MIAYQSRNGQIVQIQVDLASDNVTPLLPHNTTVTPPPPADVNCYVALVDGVYHQIPIAVPYFELSYLIQQKLDEINSYADWYYEQPVTVGGVVFDADALAKSRFAETKLIYDISGVLPPFWVTHNNEQYPITNISQITNIIMTIAGSFLTKFGEIQVMKTNSRAATTQAELDAVVVPKKPMIGMP